jgi:hypothetical protein
MRRIKNLASAIAYLEDRGCLDFWPIERLPNTKPFAKGKKFKPLDFYFLQMDPRPNAHTPMFIRTPDKPRADPCRILRKERVSPLTIIAEKWEDRETFRPCEPLNVLS